jgi:hypothetical protein
MTVLMTISFDDIVSRSSVTSQWGTEQKKRAPGEEEAATVVNVAFLRTTGGV